jgi:hypothetical protein
MNDRPWWLDALQWTIWGVVMALVMGWLGRSRLRRQVQTESGVLRHPRSTLIIGILCFGFFTALTVLSNMFPNNTATWWTTAIFVGFALMSAPMVIEFFVVRHKVSDEGLAYRKLSGQRGFLRWSELRTVRYGAGMKWFRLETHDGVVVRISAMLMGLPEFARALLRGAPTASIDSAALPILEETAEGNPPSLWG